MEMIEKLLQRLKDLFESWLEAYQNRDSERTLGAARSSVWPKFRAEHIKDYCELCLKKDIPLELHHILPFNLYPELELDHTNVVTGCRSCHLKFYHLGSFRSFNEFIKEHIKLFANLIKNRP